MDGISQKRFLCLTPPSEADNRSAQARVLDALREEGLNARMPLRVLQALPAACEASGWRVTVSLAWNGAQWVVTGVEHGDTSLQHYGYAVDLGSTTVVMRLVDCNSGTVLAQESAYNGQIAYGEDILSRIFACKDRLDKLAELQQVTLDTIRGLFDRICEEAGVAPEQCISMVVAGNTTMEHFLLGLDPFCVFSAPYAVCADKPGFLAAAELSLPLPGYVFCAPCKSNYLGGDILSGMVATGLARQKEISVFFDIGTNGELVIGNRDFLLCGAGAAGPALEGGVVQTGMRASEGAVDEVKLQDGRLIPHVIGGGAAKGICGSGIISLLAALFLAGWVDLRGKLQPDASPLISEREGTLACEYAPGLFFRQEDIDEFLRTKAAAYTMVEYMLVTCGISMDEISKFYAAGAFGAHVPIEAAVTIGMYPDLPRDRLISAGNTSLEGAQRILLNRESLSEMDAILEKMVYVQFSEVGDFVSRMVAAQALPHTDLDRFPSVRAKLKNR